MSKWSVFNVPPETVYVISGMAFPGNASTHNDRTVGWKSKFNLHDNGTESYNLI